MFYNLASLCEDMAADDIAVFDCPLKKHKAMCLANGRIVALDGRRFATDVEKCTALIHEEGHFTSGAFYKPYSPYLLKAQAEYRADKAAAMKRIPVDELKTQLARGLSVWEVADYFNVTPECIWRTYQIYTEYLGIRFDEEPTEHDSEM